MDRIEIEALDIGGIALKKIEAFVCDSCTPLLGQNVLSLFDMKTLRIEGVEFLLMTKEGLNK